MRRREFLWRTAALPAAAGAFPLRALALSDPFDPQPGPWQTFEVTTELTLPAGKAAQAWVPVPSFDEAAWMRPGKSTYDGNTREIRLTTDQRWDASMVYARWPASTQQRRLTVISTVSTRDRRVDLSNPTSPQPLSDAERGLYTASTSFIPTDGIVKETADKITAGASSDLDKARRIYTWVVANTYRKSTVRGCGLGNITFLLQTGDFGGKCADINGLAVGLARASGIPARDIYGIRVAPSRFGYKSLGANSPVITKSQHCRAEFYLADYGWVPVDPADVRKVILEEPPGDLPPQNPKVVDARDTLFGAWEGNYMAYNDGHDVPLPGSSGAPVAFLMYPQAEIDGERLDSLDAANFAYAITVRPVV